MRKLLKFLEGKAILWAVIAPIAMLLEVTMDLTQPKLMADIIDIGVANGNLSYVFNVGAKMLLVALIGLVGGSACSIFASMAAMSMGEKVRQGLFDKIQNLSFLEIDKFKTSSLITRLTNDVTQIQNMMLMALRMMVRAPLMCIGGIVMSVALSVKLSFIFLGAVPVLLVSVIVIVKKSFPLFLAVQQRIDKINVVMRENILGVRVIKAFNMEEKQCQRFDEVNDDLMDKSVKAQNMNIILWPIVTFVMNVSIICILWFGGNMVFKRSIEIGKIMAFINYLIQIMNSLMMVIMGVLSFSRATASAERINEVLETDSSIKEKANSKAIKNFDIEFKNVWFKYSNNSEYVLRNISFKVLEGEKIGIIGATGAGKSSLISLIPRLYDATSGEVLIGGVNVRELRMKDLREKIGVVLQESILFSGTIEDNLRFGTAECDFSMMESASKDAQASEFITAKENGYKSVVEQRGKNLSGGQKQRLSIARTLIKNPNILIMDDSSSALDMSTEAKLQKALNRRMEKSTVLIIAQRISAVMDSDKILVIDNGEISAMGTHKELLNISEIYRSIAISQLGEEVVSNV
ncbi:ABC transporter ATP-binding protein [Clostridium fungisolvens]|uniref:Putative ABC transporter ATP-binding protein n=1 Tax=Clostridium fungisolvens TaxID=1604897 RepID=A0A6V8SDF2_9CLOT|nr:ABC transporter ATP-binding protein [Clostridium fungisolvens]GFP75274.1 putative ABC transporter ATP-binding protein [Clostridium fungisolvens]